MRRSVPLVRRGTHACVASLLACVGSPGLMVSGTAATALGVSSASAQQASTVFSVGRVEVVYGRGSAESVPAAELLNTRAAFGRRGDGVLTAAGGDRGVTELRLGDLGPRVERFDSDGIRAMLNAVRDEFVSRTGRFAYVVPDQSDLVLRGNGEDNRSGSTDLKIVVFASSRQAPAPVSAPAPAPADVPADAAPASPASQPATRPAQQPKPQAAPAREPAQQQAQQPAQQTAPRQTQRATEETRGTMRPASAQPETQPVEQPVVQPDAAASESADPVPAAQPAPAFRAVALSRDVVAPSDVAVSDITPDEEQDGEPIRLTGFEFEYAREHPGLPAAETLGDVTARLVRVSGGWVAREGEGSLVRLGDLGAQGGATLYESALKEAMRSVVLWFGERSVVGVLVTPDPARGMLLDQDLIIDFRQDVDNPTTAIPVRVYVPRVTSVSSIASGDRIKTEDRLNSDKHSRVRSGSPLQPYTGEGRRRDLIDFSALNAYAFAKSRHPGRQVDVAIANASDPNAVDEETGENPTLGDAEVQYLVQEVKPWTIYFQLSNTGTEETDEWRERFGLVHNQLFGFDDIFSLDYITSNFRESHAVIGSYDFPLSVDGRLRMNVNGEWTKYKASEVGVADEEFSGESFAIGSELVYNFAQQDDLFWDVYAGGKYRDIEVINETADLIGDEEVFVAEAGVRAELDRPEMNLSAQAALSWSINELTGADATALEALGRPDVDKEWTVFLASLEYSFYLDALNATPGEPSALVHEVATRFSGQFAFDGRLIPNYEAIGGGLYSARGYDESVVAGDDAFFGTVEYRFHLPRALPSSDESASVFGQPFRVVRDGAGAPPDWDLMLKAFLDFGRVTVNERQVFEKNETLLSTGLGAELVIANNVSFRTDWGIVLDEVGSNSPDPIEVGDQRWHFVLTVLY